jgi:hypothetical protein
MALQPCVTCDDDRSFSASFFFCFSAGNMPQTLAAATMISQKAPKRIEESTLAAERHLI